MSLVHLRKLQLLLFKSVYLNGNHELLVTSWNGWVEFECGEGYMLQVDKSLKMLIPQWLCKTLNHKHKPGCQYIKNCKGMTVDRLSSMAVWLSEQAFQDAIYTCVLTTSVEQNTRTKILLLLPALHTFKLEQLCLSASWFNFYFTPLIRPSQSWSSQLQFLKPYLLSHFIHGPPQIVVVQVSQWIPQRRERTFKGVRFTLQDD